ncbi:hypothetical protein IWX46DRAFT_594712 [Phyllosticta citricarpa]|uniref:Uncharacterized protein n=1 Tax=Phyllosticta citricarpa TaxID=55181 RepID=A0ABR1MHV9_9PEZI
MTSILDPRSCCMRPSQLPGLDHGVLLSWRLVASPADPPPQSPVCSACSVGLFSSGSRRHDARLVGFGPKRGHRVPTWYLSMFPLVPSRDLDAFCTTLGSLVVSGRLSSCNSSPLVLREGCAEALLLPHKQQGYTRSGEAKVQACCVPAELLREIHPQPEEALPPLLVLTLVFSAAGPEILARAARLCAQYRPHLGYPHRLTSQRAGWCAVSVVKKKGTHLIWHQSMPLMGPSRELAKV